MRGAVSMALAYNQVKEKRKLSIILKNTCLLNRVRAVLDLPESYLTCYFAVC